MQARIVVWRPSIFIWRRIGVIAPAIFSQRRISMRSKYKHAVATVLVIAAFGGTVAPCFAQDPGTGAGTNAEANVGTKDPDRWFKEDVTAQARYQTSTKEAHAAYQEALKEANVNLQADLAAAKEQRKSVER
jgi:hypothetical protein